MEGDCRQGVEVDGGLQGVEVDSWLSMFEVDCSFSSREELGEGVGQLLSRELGKGVALWFKISLGWSILIGSWWRRKHCGLRDR